MTPQEGSPRQGEGLKRCEEHGLTRGLHCAEIEAMLDEVPGDFKEGDGDLPRHAVERFREAYDEAVRERDGYRSALADLLAAAHGSNVNPEQRLRARRTLKDGPR
jgi:hypothetical protein